MASPKGKSSKIRQALFHLEEALTEWDELEGAEVELAADIEKPDPRHERTRALLQELKEQLNQFVTPEDLTATSSSINPQETDL
jgi:hypothetical protein